jgi:hypothetical protein
MNLQYIHALITFKTLKLIRKRLKANICKEKRRSHKNEHFCLADKLSIHSCFNQSLLKYVKLNVKRLKVNICKAHCNEKVKIPL